MFDSVKTKSNFLQKKIQESTYTEVKVILILLWAPDSHVCNIFLKQTWKAYGCTYNSKKSTRPVMFRKRGWNEDKLWAEQLWYRSADDL